MPDRFYRGNTWKKLRLTALRRDNYFCRECARRGKPFVRASVVHHIVSREAAPELALELDNLESLCAACHNREHPEKAVHGRPKAPTGRPGRVRIIKI
jgi:5-methylcytosine-specific restriction endonuclease McrA